MSHNVPLHRMAYPVGRACLGVQICGGRFISCACQKQGFERMRKKTFFCASEKQGFERVQEKPFISATQIEPKDRASLYAAVFQPGQPTEGGNSRSGPPGRAVSPPAKQTRKGRDRRKVTQAWVLCLRCPGFRGGVPFSFS